jgi:hypothetical protein
MLNYIARYHLPAFTAVLLYALLTIVACTHTYMANAVHKLSLQQTAWFLLAAAHFTVCCAAS